MPKILLIEDDEMLHTMYTQKFEKEGYTMVSAHNGSEGVKKAQEETPDLILLDIIMPKRPEIETFKQLLKIDPNFKIVIYSGHT